MEVLDAMHCGKKARRVGRMSGDAGAIPNMRLYTDGTRSQRLQSVQLWVWSSRFGRFSWEGLNTVRQEKAPVRCPCSRLSILHGALSK